LQEAFDGQEEEENEDGREHALGGHENFCRGIVGLCGPKFDVDCAGRDPFGEGGKGRDGRDRSSLNGFEPKRPVRAACL